MGCWGIKCEKGMRETEAEQADCERSHLREQEEPGHRIVIADEVVEEGQEPKHDEGSGRGEDETPEREHDEGRTDGESGNETQQPETGIEHLEEGQRSFRQNSTRGRRVPFVMRRALISSLPLTGLPVDFGGPRIRSSHHQAILP